MIRFELYPGFTHAYKKRIAQNAKFRKQADERIEMFQANPQNSLLHDHPLKGNKQGLRAFSVTGDVRIVYFIEDDIAYFVNIGTHN
jgi:addiction module RelE/StbE family toxin